MDSIEGIKKEVKSGKLVIGKKETLTLMREGKLARVFLAANCPQSLEAEFEHAGKTLGVQIEKLPIANDELGVICKRQYSISVLGEKKP